MNKCADQQRFLKFIALYMVRRQAGKTTARQLTIKYLSIANSPEHSVDQFDLHLQIEDLILEAGLKGPRGKFPKSGHLGAVPLYVWVDGEKC